MRFVLASASPARLDTLHRAGLRPDVIVSGVDESTITAPTTAGLVAALAAAKVDAVLHDLPVDDDVVALGCDSLLDVDGRSLGKPADAAEARSRWRAMQGRTGTLHTGHALRRRDADGHVIAAERTSSTAVRFGTPSDDELDAYLGSGEPLAVAGAFTIDGLGGWFVDGVDGDPHTVVGVSLPVLRHLFSQLEVSLLDLDWPLPRTDTTG